MDFRRLQGFENFQRAKLKLALVRKFLKRWPLQTTQTGLNSKWVYNKEIVIITAKKNVCF